MTDLLSVVFPNISSGFQMTIGLIITDDVSRGNAIAANISSIGLFRIHHIKNGLPALILPKFIITDIKIINKESITGLRQIIDTIDGTDIPHLFLAHDNDARTKACARLVGAAETLSAHAFPKIIINKLKYMIDTKDPIEKKCRVHAIRSKFFVSNTLFSGRPVTRDIAHNGAESIENAIRDVGINSWIKTVRQFDNMTYQHCLLVTGIAAAFSGIIGFSIADRIKMTKAALLHDVGKIKIPPNILNKPGPLDQDELEIIRTHPLKGYNLLRNGGFRETTLSVVRSHHEMLDGSGYPDNLRDNEINDLVRLITICDIFSALIEYRTYKDPISAQSAFQILLRMSDKLDQDFVKAFKPIVDNCGGAEKNIY